MQYCDCGKKQRYEMRNQIENIVKDERVNRNRFHEVSKLEYEDIIRKFYYTFCDYKKFPTIKLDYLWLRFHESLQSTECKRCRDWNSYIEEMAELVPAEQQEQKVYLILDYGWVYEGFLPEIQTVLLNTDGLLEDFYIVSKHYEWVIAHSEDGEAMCRYWRNQ